MGFYSFYRIIKDIIRTVFGKRFLRLVLIIVIIMLVLGSLSSCFASYDIVVQDRNDNSYTFTLSDELMSFNYYYVFYQKTTTSYQMDYLCFIGSDYEMLFDYQSFNNNNDQFKTLYFADGLSHEYKEYITKRNELSFSV